MGVTVVTPPATEPVTLQEAKDHLRLDTDAHDAMLQVQIQAAREHVEMFTRRQLVTATYLLTLPAFASVIALPYPPLQAVTQVQYRDAQGVLQVLPEADYSVDTSSEPGRLYVTTIPATGTALDAVQITFDAGYGVSGTDVPARARQAILLLVGDFYEHAEAQATETLTDNLTVGRLLWGFRAEVLS